MDPHPQHRLTIKLDGKNYFMWASYMQNFIEGQELWGHIDGSIPISSQKWSTNNAKIKTWIMKFVDISIAVNLSNLPTAKNMWEFLERIYKRANQARLYKLEQDLISLSQESKSIQEFYSAMMLIWKEMDMMDTNISAAAYSEILKTRNSSRAR